MLDKTLKFSEIENGIFRTENLKIATGKYLLEYVVDGITKKQTIFIW